MKTKISFKKIRPVYVVICFLVIISCLSLFSCNKNDAPSPGKEKDNGYGLSGSIIFNWATEGILKIDLKSGNKSTVLPENNAQYGWDVSRDGQKILQSTDDPNDIDANDYTYSDINTGKIVAQFAYYPTDGDLTNGFISPDGTMVAISPTFDDGIVILNMEGKILYNLTGFAGQSFGNNTEIAWMPDNSLLFTLGAGIYRTNTDFTKATLIKKVNFQSWGDISVSMDGEKIALDGGNHIWMMNSDGSNLVQVTESNDVEKNSTFSPNGKYLLIGTDWHVTGPFGSIWYLAVIPADGQKYNVNKGEDKRVVFIKSTESPNNEQPCDGYMYWR